MDVEEDAVVVDQEAVAADVRLRTRAIVPVHLFGDPADTDSLQAIADKHGLLLLQRASQAHGVRYKGRRCGALGDGVTFSFYPTKNLGALGGGR
jgi:dTDP-4-amino-4,6-dideoxygalactose transaminase